MFSIGEKVRVLKTGVVGIVVDVDNEIGLDEAAVRVKTDSGSGRSTLRWYLASELTVAEMELTGYEKRSEDYLRTLQWPSDDTGQAERQLVETHIRYFSRWLALVKN